VATIHSSSYSKLIDAIIDGRKAAGMTQVQLAEIWKKTQPIIAKIEAKERRLDVLEFLEVCLILELNPNLIISDVHNHLKGELFARAGH
jgi:hypothetical protein